MRNDRLCVRSFWLSTDNTEALRNDPVRSESILSRIPAGRWGDAVDFAGPTVFLCSEAASYMHGTTMLVDGGWMGRGSTNESIIGNLLHLNCGPSSIRGGFAVLTDQAGIFITCGL
jgi:hypothetical protein